MSGRQAPLGQHFAFGANGTRYAQERTQRWSMEKIDGPTAVAALRRQVGAVLGIPAEAIRADAYAETFARLRQPTTPAELGRPDLRLSFDLDGKPLHLFCELKIKTKAFQKTRTGGLTAKGSTIPRYGCPSFYLDADPVLPSVRAFCRAAPLAPARFVFVFADPVRTAGRDPEIRLASLGAVERLLQDGFRGVPLKTDFAEGYGAPCILVPLDATRPPAAIAREDLLRACEPAPLAPPSVRMRPYPVSGPQAAER
jgi:hypothetical protein